MPSLPSWLSRGATKPEEAVEATPASTSTSPPATATPKDKEEDNSGATGGADSDDNQVGATVIVFLLSPSHPLPHDHCSFCDTVPE